MNAWVGIPYFLFDTPEPLLINSVIDTAKADLKSQGFSGGEFHIAAHSLGTVMAQIYIQSDDF
jgi:hypothetical protein